MKLAYRLWLLLLIPITMALGLYGVLAHERRHTLLMNEASAELRNHATLVEASLGYAAERGELELLKQRIERLARAERILGIAAFDARGGLLMSTEQIDDVAAELSALARRAIQRGDALEERRELAGRSALIRSVLLPRLPAGSSVVVLVVRDLGYIDALAATSDRGLLFTGAALVLLTAFIAAVASRVTVGRPAQAIVAGVERVAAGELDAKVPEQGAEELMRLARAFNAMTAALAEARARAEREEQARAVVERRLQHAQALSAVGQIAASIGHEVGSPLNVILGRARRAADQPDCPAPLRQELETIAAQSERISRVMAKLLAVSRPPQLGRKGSDPVQVVQEVLAFLAPECRQRRIQAAFEAPPAAAAVGLDADRLFQVIFNLVLNAVQAQGEGGQVAVRVAAKAERTAGPRMIVFEVEDRGPGIPPELAAHVFEAFFTSKGDRGGSGLGLTIVSGIVREAGGTVELVPTTHGGACFRVALPAQAAASRFEIATA